jgi:hypothetical protein
MEANALSNTDSEAENILAPPQNFSIKVVMSATWAYLSLWPVASKKKHCASNIWMLSKVQSVITELPREKACSKYCRWVGDSVFSE